MVCEKEVRDSLAVLRRRERLPDICHQCGRHTDRRTRLRARTRAPPAAPDPMAGMAKGLLGPLFLVLEALDGLLNGLWYAVGRGHWQVALRVPQCRDCRKRAPARHVAVDYDKKTTTFDVHEKFNRELERLRARWDLKR